MKNLLKYTAITLAILVGSGVAGTYYVAEKVLPVVQKALKEEASLKAGSRGGTIPYISPMFIEDMLVYVGRATFLQRVALRLYKAALKDQNLMNAIMEH